MWWHVTNISWFVTSVIMTKACKQFLISFSTTSLPLCTLTRKLKCFQKPLLKETGGSLILMSLLFFFTSFHTHCLCIFCIRNNVHLVLFFIWNRTEILNFESNTEPSKKYRNSIDTSVNRYTPKYLCHVIKSLDDRLWESFGPIVRVCTEAGLRNILILPETSLSWSKWGIFKLEVERATTVSNYWQY